MRITSLINIIILTATLGVGLFVFLKNARGKINRIFTSIVFSLAFWMLSSTLSDIATSDAGALLWAQLSIVTPFFFTVLFYYFSLSFPIARPGMKRWKKILLAFIAVIPTLFTFTKLNIVSVTKESWGTDFAPGQLYTILFLYLVLFVGGGLLNLWKSYQRYPARRMQILYVFGAIFSVLIIGTTTNITLPFAFGIGIASTIGPGLAMLMFTTLTAYTIVVYRLMDIRVIIRLGAVFTALFTLIAAFYFVAATVLGNIFTGPLSVLIPAFIIAISYAPLKKYIERITDRFFFQKQYNFNDVLNTLEDTIHHVGPDTKRIIEYFNTIMLETFKVQHSSIGVLVTEEYKQFQKMFDGSNITVHALDPHSAMPQFFANQKTIIFLDKEELARKIDAGTANSEAPLLYKELEQLNAAFVVSVRGDDHLHLLYMLGPKRSQDMYYHEDVELIKHAAGELATALANARLYENLKAALEVKSQFISVVSHQMRTPISAIRWSLELLQQKGLAKEKQLEFLANAYHSSIFVVEQLDDVLTALDIQDGRVPLHKETCDVIPTVDELVGFFTHQLNDKQLKLTSHLTGFNGNILCDAPKIKKVMRVLLHNAITYTPAHGEITIRSEKKEVDGKQQLIVSVKDTGIGVTEEERAHIFERFYRSEKARLVLPDGMGLGMFIANEFVKAHGGQLWVESDGRDKGSTFSFSIPIA